MVVTKRGGLRGGGLADDLNFKTRTDFRQWQKQVIAQKNFGQAGLFDEQINDILRRDRSFGTLRHRTRIAKRAHEVGGGAGKREIRFEAFVQPMHEWHN